MTKLMELAPINFTYLPENKRRVIHPDISDMKPNTTAVYAEKIKGSTASSGALRN